MSTSNSKNYFYLIGFIAFCAVIYSTRYILVPFLISFAIAYALDPLVDKLETWKLPRIMAIWVFFLMILIVLSSLALVIIPLIKIQIEKLASDVPGYIKITQQWLSPFLESIIKENPARIKEIISSFMEKFGSIPLKLLSSATSFLWSSFSSILNFIMSLISLIIIPISCFYLLKDIDSLKEKIKGLLPHRYRKAVCDLLEEINEVLSSFIRGQIAVSVLLAVLYSAGLLLIGTPMSIIIGIVAGLANIVPYMGIVIGLIPALVLTLLQFHDLHHVFGVLLVFGIVQSLEGMVITPRIVGDKIGLHPVVVMLSILVGGHFGGVIGIIFAVPIAAVCNVVLTKGIKNYKESTIFLQE